MKSMKQKLGAIFLGLTMAVAIAGSGVSVALADCANPTSTKEAVQCGANNGQNVDTSAAAGSFSTTVSDIINVMSIIVGVVAVIMIIVAGLRYITSGGKQESVTGAKNTILYAVIGLVIVALAQIIVHFVLNNTTAATNGSDSSSSGTSVPHGASVAD